MLMNLAVVSKSTRICPAPVGFPDGPYTYLQFRDATGINHLSPGAGRDLVSDPALCVTNPIP